MQTVYAGGSGSGGSQQREVADGADVVYTHTTPLKSQSGADVFYPNVLWTCSLMLYPHLPGMGTTWPGYDSVKYGLT